MRNIPICMAEEYWANSQLSIARYYGGIKIEGQSFDIVNKKGITLYELNDPTSKHYVGDDAMLIEPGEPADLVRAEWIPLYKKVGRERFFEIVKQTSDMKEAKRMAKEKRAE